MSCYQTPTGIKFLLFTEPNMEREKAEGVLRKCYELYAEFVMRNPFYNLDMPVRCEKVGWGAVVRQIPGGVRVLAASLKPCICTICWTVSSECPEEHNEGKPPAAASLQVLRNT